MTFLWRFVLSFPSRFFPRLLLQTGRVISPAFVCVCLIGILSIPGCASAPSLKSKESLKKDLKESLSESLSESATLNGGANPTRPSRATLQAFQLEGRLSVRDGDKNVYVSINWQHTPNSDEIAISGPLGQGLANLSANASGALLETADHKRFEARDLDALSAQVFGVSLPVSNMSYWVLGRPGHTGNTNSTSPAATESVSTVDALGRLTHLTEEGWDIDYLRYEDDLPEQSGPNALPTLLHAQRDDVELRLKVDVWSELQGKAEDGNTNGLE